MNQLDQIFQMTFAEQLQSLQSPDWRVRYAAAVALGDRRDPPAIAGLLAALRLEDAAPLYSQKEELGGTPAGANFAPRITFPPGTTPAIQDAWQRRGRLKQAICLALGQIGQAEPTVLAMLHRYVGNVEEDYTVRAAAAKALGQLRSPLSRPFLEKGAQDEEFCARTEARKALAQLPN